MGSQPVPTSAQATTAKTPEAKAAAKAAAKAVAPKERCVGATELLGWLLLKNLQENMFFFPCFFPMNHKPKPAGWLVGWLLVASLLFLCSVLQVPTIMQVAGSPTTPILDVNPVNLQKDQGGSEPQSSVAVSFTSVSYSTIHFLEYSNHFDQCHCFVPRLPHGCPKILFHMI